jgi:hypothetical protein
VTGNRDVAAMKTSFTRWYVAMPKGWQDSYTEMGGAEVAYTHGWDDRIAHAQAGPHREHARLLGHRVKVTIADQVLVTGRFLAYGEFGEFLIQDDEMDVIRCWPLLTIEAAEEAQV